MPTERGLAHSAPWRALLLALFSLVSGCLRAAEDRAERDREVGHQTGRGLSVDVAEGHAAILELTEDRLLLWGSVPALEFTLRRPDGAARPLELEVHNLMPGAELRLRDGSGVEIGEPVRTAPTRAVWQLAWSGSDPIRLSLGPPDSALEEGFEFALLSDVQEAIDRFHDMVERLNDEAGVRFVLGAGDLTSNGSRRELARFKRELEPLGVPYYATLGNHELGEDPPPYQDMFGRGNYSFTFHGLRFTMLDSASATLDPLVVDWLDAWLAEGRGQTHVVAMHIPPLDPSGTRHGAFASKAEAAKLLNRLKQAGVDLTLYGHIHTYIHFENAGIDAHIAGGGGAIPNRGDGIGRHYLVVNADPRRGIVSTHVVQVDSDWTF